MNTRYLGHDEVQEVMETRKTIAYSIKGNDENNNRHWMWYFYLGDDDILEVLAINSKLIINMIYNGVKYPSLCELEIRVGLIKKGNYTKYEKIFEDMETTGKIQSIRVINEQLGITEEEENTLLEIFKKEHESGIEELKGKLFKEVEYRYHRPS